MCSFSVAVNKRRQQQEGQPQTDYFRVTAWRQLAEICAKYLDKGKKVCVIGSISLSTYIGNDGQNHASMEVSADDVEFLSPKDEQGEAAPAQAPARAPSAYNRAAEQQYLMAEREGIKNDSVSTGSKYVEVTPEDESELPF